MTKLLLARFLTFSTVLSVLIAAPVQAAEGNTSDPKFITQFEQAARSEFKRRLRTLRRPLKFYHYGTRGDENLSAFTTMRGRLEYANQEAIDYLGGQKHAMTPSPLKPAAAVKYFKQLAATHASPDGQQVWNVGAGVYFATDPVQSERYLGLPWFLLEIELPASVRYLDIRGDNKLVLPEAILEVYRKIDYRDGPPMHGAEGVLGNGVIFGRLMRDDDTRTVLVKLFKEFQVDFIAYTWEKPSYRLCIQGRESLSGVAINVINPDLIDRARSWNFFVAGLEAQPSPEKKAAYLSVLEKIELGFLRDDLIQRESSEIEYSFSSAHDWTARVATYGWNAALGRRSPLDALVGPRTLRRLGTYVNARPWEDEQGDLKFVRSAATLQVIRETPRAERAYLPEIFARRFHPHTTAAVERRIQEETWGCGADGKREEGIPVR